MGLFSTRAPAVVGLSFVLALTAACGGGKPAATGGADRADGKSGNAGTGKQAPDLSIQTLNGKGAVSLESLSGKVAIVDFWATWCGPCKDSFPKLDELAKQNQGKVQVIGISVDDSRDGVLDWAKAQGASFPIGWDDGHSIAKRWKVDKMPTTYLLDGAGTVRFVHEGYRPEEAELMAKEIAILTSEPAKAKAGGDKPASESAAASGAPAGTTEEGAEPAAEPATPVKPKKVGKPKAGMPKKIPPKKKKPAAAA